MLIKIVRLITFASFAIIGVLVVFGVLTSVIPDNVVAAVAFVVVPLFFCSLLMWFIVSVYSKGIATADKR